MIKRLARFIASEDGAITVDWVVLSAALIGLGMVLITPIVYSTDNRAKAVSDFVKSVKVGEDAFAD